MSTKTTKPVVKIDNGSEYSEVYSKDKVDQLIASSSGGSKIYRHIISVSGDNGNDITSCIYFTWISSSNLKADSIANLNALLGTEEKCFSCTGYIADGTDNFSAICTCWKSNYDTSFVEYFETSSGYGFATLNFTTIFEKNAQISDIVTAI